MVAPRQEMCGRGTLSLTLAYSTFRLNHSKQRHRVYRDLRQGELTVTKKEIVKQISDELGLTQLKTKEIVQKTFDAIVETLIREQRIELRNFGVFEVKRRKARKARNPRTGERVDVEPKNVVTFKPGKEMEERVRNLANVPEMCASEESDLLDGEGREEALASAGGRSTDTLP